MGMYERETHRYTQIHIRTCGYTDEAALVYTGLGSPSASLPSMSTSMSSFEPDPRAPPVLATGTRLKADMDLEKIVISVVDCRSQNQRHELRESRKDSGLPGATQALSGLPKTRSFNNLPVEAKTYVAWKIDKRDKYLLDRTSLLCSLQAAH